MATIESYQTKSDKELREITHRTPNGRASRSNGYETNCDAKEFASIIEVSKMRGENVGTLWTRDAAKN